MIHSLKTDKNEFQAVLDGRKKFEIRFNDRNYQIGDELWLKETKHTREEMKSGAPLRYTGRMIALQVSHIMLGPCYGLKSGWCIMSILRA